MEHNNGNFLSLQALSLDFTCQIRICSNCQRMIPGYLGYSSFCTCFSGSEKRCLFNYFGRVSSSGRQISNFHLSTLPPSAAAQDLWVRCSLIFSILMGLLYQANSGGETSLHKTRLTKLSVQFLQDVFRGIYGKCDMFQGRALNYLILSFLSMHF